MSNLEEYLERFCAEHGCTKEEALEKAIIKEYIEYLKERDSVKTKGAENGLSSM